MRRILVGATCVGLFVAAPPASAQLEPILDPLGIADTSISMSDQPGKVKVGENFRYRVTVKDNGPSAANEVLVQTRLAHSLDFVRARGTVLDEAGAPLSSPPVTCTTPWPHLVNCRIETLEAGQRARMFVTVTPTLRGFPKSRASVESEEIDQRPRNNNRREGTVVR